MPPREQRAQWWRDGGGAGAGTGWLWRVRRREEVAELIVAATEPLRRGEALEAPHTSDAPFNAPMILFRPVILICTGPVHDALPERAADRPRVRAVPVGGDLVGRHAGGGRGRAEEGLGRGYVAVLAQHGVDEVAVTVDSPVEIAPATPHLQVGFVDMPAAAASAAPAVTAPAQFIGQGGRELRLPVPYTKSWRA